MSQTTAIGWTESTWNPWWGCDHVSPGCDHCYAETLMKRGGRDFSIKRTKQGGEPLKWKEPRMIFTCSMSDFFHAGADEWREEAWEVIRRTPQHTYQILTKRPGRIARHLPSDWGEGYPNVWLGVSTENQEWANRRIPVLLAVPARVRFISAEPLLGPLDLLDLCDGLHWVIIGGESGPDFRPLEPLWVIDIVNQCGICHIACFTKQDSGRFPGKQGRIPDAYWKHEFPAPQGGR